MLSLSKYEIGKVIFENSDAVLYLGQRIDDRTEVVIKTHRSEYPTAIQLARLRHEYAILQGLNLPAVVKALALEKSGGGLALILSAVDGVPLNQLIQLGRLELGDALRIASAIAEAIEQVHQCGVMHKDLKPANLIVNPRTHQVTLIDFGIATRLAQQAQRPLNPEAIEGSLAYMSPEQTGRMNRTLDHRTDLYSLGITIYEMLTGALPFQQIDPIELVHSHIARTPVSPHVLAPDIPVVVSDIVMRLLAKNAEDRYQTARGLAADLRTCLQAWDQHRRIGPFPLGHKDHSAELRTPKRLYGRATEVAAVFAAFERASEGKVELLMVSGYSGVGKSMLVHELYKASIRQRGYFVSGKFDQHSRGVPYGSLVQSFRELLRQLLSENSEALAQWKARLWGALRSNGALLIALLPELELIIGPQPAVQEVGPTESQNRFNLVLRSFMQVFTYACPPLVLFLDDLQWADPASLKLLCTLLTDPELSSLLVIGAYRDNAVDAVHPLTLALDSLRKSELAISELKLCPMELATVAQLLTDTLHCDLQRAEPLARLVFEKTSGNPFFVGQFLRTLHESQLLLMNRDTGEWEWDLKRIEGAGITDNVVELMTTKLQRLAHDSLQLLMRAACIGYRFDLETLALLEGRPHAEVAALLWDALQEGLVLCLDPESRVLCLTESGVESVERVTYQFLHDRVQQAAYNLLAEESRQQIHLALGRKLRGPLGQVVRDELLFEVVNHLNLAASAMVDAAEQSDLARLDLQAGRRAKAATAYEAACGFLTAGMAIGGDGWQHERELTFALHMEYAESLFLRGQFEQVEPLFDDLLRHSSSPLQRLAVQKLRLILYSTVGRMTAALQIGLATLTELGIDLPADPAAQKEALPAASRGVQQSLAGRAVSELINASVLADSDLLAAMDLALALWAPAVYTSPLLAALISIKLVTLSLSRGHGPAAAPSYASFGMILLNQGQFRQAAEFGRLALQLDAVFHVVAQTAKVHVAAAVSCFFFTPLRTTLEVLDRAYRVGLEAGDFLYPSVASYLSACYRFFFIGEVGSLREDVAKYLKVVLRNKDPNGAACLTIVSQALANLQGRTLGRHTLSDASFDEDAFVAMLRGGRHWRAALFYYCVVKLALCFAYKDYRTGLVAAAEAAGLTEAIFGGGPVIELVFYSLLTLAALWDGASAAEQQRYREQLDKHLAQLAEWNRYCPGNVNHRYLLATAEVARLEGRHNEANELYEQAIDAARAGEYYKDEALANELAARYHLSRQRVRLARLHLTDAYYGYTRLEATALADDTLKRHPDLLIQTGGAGTKGGLSTATTQHRSEALDSRTAIKASQALSGEISLDKLLARLMNVVTESAGAERGALLLTRGGELWVGAEISAEQRTVVMTEPVRLAQCQTISQGIVYFVARTQQSVRLSDAANAGAFIRDPYVVSRQPKSVLCLPLLHQSRVQGVLYLENNLTPGAFTEERAELLVVLGSQMAISIENAYLYADLEQRVEERTRQLREAQERLLRLEREATEVQMAGGFAHEMRNVLASAKMMLYRVLPSSSEAAPSLCMQNSDQLKSLFLNVKPHIPAEVRRSVVETLRTINGNEQLLDAAIRSVDGLLKRGLNITGLIMDYSRVGQARPGNEQVALRPLLETIVAQSVGDFAAHGIAVQLDLPEGLALPGTEAHFYSILTNLINNARDAILDVKDRKQGRIRVSAVNDSQGAVLKVADDGIGIPPENRSKLFMPFFSTKPDTGTGLGLGMVQRLVTLYGGSVTFESEVGRGTTFSVALPNHMGMSFANPPGSSRKQEEDGNGV